MPRIEADFTKISSTFQPLPDGDYQFHIDDVTYEPTKENNLPMVTIHMTCNDPAHPDLDGYPYRVWIVTQTKEKKPNRSGLSQLKAFAEATIGEEAANNPSGIDPDEFKGSDVVLSLKLGTRKDKQTQEEVPTNELRKVLRAG